MAASYDVRTVFTSGRFRRSFPSFIDMNRSNTPLRMIAFRPIRSTGIFSHSTSFLMVFLPMPVYSDASSMVIPILTSAIQISSISFDNPFLSCFHDCSFPVTPFLVVSIYCIMQHYKTHNKLLISVCQFFLRLFSFCILQYLFLCVIMVM